MVCSLTSYWEKKQQQNFPKRLCIGNEEIKNLKSIAEHFNKLFTEIGPNLANYNDLSSMKVTYENYLKALHTNQPERNLIISELEDVFFSLIHNKSPGYDKIILMSLKKNWGLCINHYSIFSTKLCKMEIFPMR